MSKRKETLKGFREILHCGANVERIEIFIYHKHKAFQRRRVEKHIYTKGSFPVRIIIEDSSMWGKPF